MAQAPTEVDFLERQIEKFVESLRPDPEVRSQLDIGFEWENNILILFEIRPDWQDSTIIRQFPFAKARFIKSRNLWKIFWLRANGKWEAYPEEKEVARLDQVLKIIEEDKLHCFRG